MNSNKPYIEHGIKWGLLAFLITGTLHFVFYLTNMEFALGNGRWVILAITIVVYVFQGLFARKISGNGLKYGQAFLTLLFTAIVSSFLFLTTDFVVKNYVDPTLVDQEKIITIRNAEMGMEKFGMAQEKIDAAIDKMHEQDFTPTVLNSLGKLFWSVLFNSVLILIVAAFIKKKPREPEPVFTETTE